MAPDGAVTLPDVEPTGRRNPRLRQTIGDMVRSMLLVLAVVGAILLVTWRPSPEAVKVIDITPVLAFAESTATFPLTSPVGLSDGWRPTSARFEPTEKSVPDPVLHIGYVTPADAYAQVSQSTNRTSAYSAEQTDSGRPVGSLTVDGSTWEKWERGDRRSLVRSDDAVLTIVSGGATWEELTTLAASLEPLAAS
jgi:hypothetical protein